MTIQAPSAALAIDGGDPIRPIPMPPRIQVDERELDAVTHRYRHIHPETVSIAFRIRHTG